MGQQYRYGRVKYACGGVIALLLSLQGGTASAQPPEVSVTPPPRPLGPPPLTDVSPSRASEQLEMDLQNPLAKRIVIPVQYTTNFEVGPEERTQHQVNLQPIYPFSVGDKASVILRAILPIMSNPDPEDSDGRVTGLGDTTLTAYVAPSQLKDLMAGLGPAFLFPTATDDVLGSGQWGIGPSLAVIGQPAEWTLGSLITQYWSFAGEDDRPDVNRLEIQPVVSYRLGGGISLNYAGIITADWEQSGDDRWTLPIGATVSYLLASKLPMQLLAGGGVNAVKPDDAADWFLRFQLNMVLPGG